MVALVPLLAHHLERSRAARVQAQARVRRSAVGPLRWVSTFAHRLCPVMASDQGEAIAWRSCDLAEPRSECGDENPMSEATAACDEQGEGYRLALRERVATGGATAPMA